MELNRKLRILVVFANHGGCSYYRQLSPMKMLEEEQADKVEVEASGGVMILPPKKK